MSSFKLTRKQRLALLMQLKSTHNAEVYRRTLALLCLDMGCALVKVASLLHVERHSIQRWILRYKKSRKPSSLLHQMGQGRPSLCTGKVRALLRLTLNHSPLRYGYHTANWTVPLLWDYLTNHDAIEISQRTVRRQLNSLGFVWKRFRYILNPDPDGEKKTAYYYDYQTFSGAKRCFGGR